MAYTERNFRTKADLKRALAAGESIAVFQPGPFGPAVSDGTIYLEGPHFPAPHTWYAQGQLKNGKLVKVK